MKNQEIAFLNSEGDQWFLRNKEKIKNHSPEISLLCNWLLPFEKEIVNILEIGSGPGNKLAQLSSKLNANGYGVEPSKKAVDYANQNYNANCKFFIGTADNLTSFDLEFDLIHFGFCLYLISRNKVVDVIKSIDSLLKPGKFLSIVDFDPCYSFENDYAHLNGIKSYKAQYFNMFCELGHFTLVNKYSFSEAQFSFAKKVNNRISLTLLYKEK